MHSRRGLALMRLLLFLAIGALLALLALWWALDRLAASGISKAGTYALGVPTEVASADIGLVSGHFGIEGMTIDNPQGFSGRFLEMKDASTDVSFSKLMGDRIEIDRVVVEGVKLKLERKDGRTNYQALLDNLAKLSDPNAPKSEDSGPSKKFVIHTIELRDIEAEIGLLPPVPSQSVRIASLKLENVGNDGASLAKVFERVVAELLGAVAGKAGDLFPDDLKKGLEASLGKLGDVGKQALGALEGGLEMAGEGVQQAAEKAKKGLQGLFGK